MSHVYVHAQDSAAVDEWIRSVRTLRHNASPMRRPVYTNAMPDIEPLMQAWHVMPTRISCLYTHVMPTSTTCALCCTAVICTARCLRCSLNALGTAASSRLYANVWIAVEDREWKTSEGADTRAAHAHAHGRSQAATNGGAAPPGCPADGRARFGSCAVRARRLHSFGHPDTRRPAGTIVARGVYLVQRVSLQPGPPTFHTQQPSSSTLCPVRLFFATHRIPSMTFRPRAAFCGGSCCLGRAAAGPAPWSRSCVHFPTKSSAW